MVKKPPRNEKENGKEIPFDKFNTKELHVTIPMLRRSVTKAQTGS